MDGRFEVDGSVVRDTCTHLMWQRVPPSGQIPWSAAQAFARDLTLGGFDDWRVPNVHELLSLVHYGRTEPALHPAFDFSPEDDVAVGPSSIYWSSTSVNDPGNKKQAWRVDFSQGTHDFVEKSQNLATRVVRGGSIPSKPLPLIPACTLTLSP
ncbi:MAG: DUF1566 domain-containing protein [Nitrospinales bacterium]